MGGAPPHTDNRIRQAARGQGQVGLFKNNAPVALSLLFWLSDSREHGLNISETPRSCALQRAPVRWTLTLKTNHLWSLGPCQCRNTTEQRLQSRAEESFPGDVTQQRFPEGARTDHVTPETKNWTHAGKRNQKATDCLKQQKASITNKAFLSWLNW